MAGFAGPARRLRSDGRQKPGSAEVACLEQVTIAPMWSRAPAQRRRALLPARRHRPPSALVGLCLTSQIDILLNCQVLGRIALSISSSQELCRFLRGCSPRPNDMVSRIFINHSDRESPNGVPKRGDCDSRFSRKRRPSRHGHRPTRNVLHEGADDLHDTDAELWTSLSNNEWWLWIRAFGDGVQRDSVLRLHRDDVRRDHSSFFGSFDIRSSRSCISFI
jgi:hypothetical protein